MDPNHENAGTAHAVPLRKYPHALAPRAATMLLALMLAISMGISAASPARADSHRGVYFDRTPDTTLPDPAISRQLVNSSANGGFVHVPFSAGDLRTLLSGSTFNGAATVDGTDMTVATAYGVPAFNGDVVSSDRLVFGLSANGVPSGCDFTVLFPVLGDTPTSDQSVAINYVIGGERTSTAKLGYVRMRPTAGVAGQWLCMYRETQILEVNNPTPKYYDAQRSPIVMTRDRITLAVDGSTPAPAAEEETESEEQAEAPEPETVDEGTDEATATEEDPDAEDTEAEVTEDQEVTTQEAEEDDAATPATPATPAETATEDEADEEATLETAADVVDDEGGQSLLIPILLGLIVVLLGGLLLILARGRKQDQPASSTVAAAPPAPSSPAPAATEPHTDSTNDATSASREEPDA